MPQAEVKLWLMPGAPRLNPMHKTVDRPYERKSNSIGFKPYQHLLVSVMIGTEPWLKGICRFAVSDLVWDAAFFDLPQSIAIK